MRQPPKPPPDCTKGLSGSAESLVSAPDQIPLTIAQVVKQGIIVRIIIERIKSVEFAFVSIHLSCERLTTSEF